MEPAVQYYGDYIEAQEPGKEYLDINFSSSVLNVDQLWENSVLSAKFLSSFWGQFFPASNKEHHNTRRVMQDSVRFIVSELLGNAAKFGDGNGYDIRVNLHMEQQELRFYVTNVIDPAVMASFQTFIQRILTEDLDAMYLAQMEKSVATNNPESGLGYLTMVLDYDARIAWKFERKGDLDVITTFVALPVVRTFAMEGDQS